MHQQPSQSNNTTSGNQDAHITAFLLTHLLQKHSFRSIGTISTGGACAISTVAQWSLSWSIRAATTWRAAATFPKHNVYGLRFMMFISCCNCTAAHIYACKVQRELKRQLDDDSRVRGTFGLVQVVRAGDAKQIVFDQESRYRLQAGINKVADAVGVTLGPRGEPLRNMRRQLCHRACCCALGYALQGQAICKASYLHCCQCLCVCRSECCPGAEVWGATGAVLLHPCTTSMYQLYYELSTTCAACNSWLSMSCRSSMMVSRLQELLS